jgi:hypothetical protein
MKASSIAKRFSYLKAGVREAGLPASSMPAWALANASMTKSVVFASEVHFCDVVACVYFA